MNQEQFEEVKKEVDRAIQYMDGVLNNLNQAIMQRIDQERAFVNSKAKWQPYVSWIPRKVGRRWYWHSPIYRKMVLDETGRHWIYGTEFDVLKETR